MTTPINLEETYNELSNLLKDICSFINTEVQNGTLSPDALNHAKKLINRCKEQEDTISKIAVLQESTNSNYPYLQMQGPGMREEPVSEYVDPGSMNHYEEETYEDTENYAFVENETVVSMPPPSSMIIEDYCPYLELPLSQLSQKAIKCGPLIRKERYFIIEQKKQLFVGLVGYWLLVYCANKKDVKPLQVVNLTEYKAQAKKDPIFEIVSENKKTYEFIAKSAKDMDQWIVAINCKRQLNTNNRNLPSVPDVDHSDDNTVDSFDNSNNNISHHSDLDIYENVDDIRRTENTVSSLATHDDTDDDAPKLPARQQFNYTRKTENKSSENSTYNNVTINSTSVEEEDEDNTYDPVQNGEIEEEDEIYDEPKIAETINRQVKLPYSPPETEYDNEDDEDCSYDIPRCEKQEQQTTNNYDEYEDEDVEYDELKILPQNNNEQKKPELKIDTTTPEKTKPKPVITSPKPKLQGRLEKLTSFSRKSDNSENSQEGSNNSKRIHNIIQQMEASLTFKGKN